MSAWRSEPSAMSESTSKAMTRYVSHPQIMAGKTNAKGGTNQSGKVNSRAPKARSKDNRLQSKLCNMLAPRFRSRVGKRRSATMRVKPGVMKAETENSETTTTKGVTAKITSKGATTVFRSGTPSCSIQLHRDASRLNCSRNWRTPDTAASQYR